MLAEFGQTGVVVLDACRRMALPLIVHFHGADISKHQTLRTYGEAYRILFREARAIVVLDACRDLARGQGVAPAVTFFEAQPHGVIREEMRHARGFVQHSIEAPSGDSEGMPVAILEAGASGLPVVATRHAGIPDAVIEGTTGVLVDEHDVDGMAEGMLRLIDDPALATRLGHAAREHVTVHFSMERSLGRLWAIIERCIAGHPPVRAGEPEASAEFA